MTAARYLLTLGVLFLGVAAASQELQFLFDTATPEVGALRQVYVYEGSPWMSRRLALSFLPENETSRHGDVRMELVSKGQRHTLTHHMRRGRETPVLSLSTAASNPLWMAWRYATWNNVTLLLSPADATPPEVRPDLLLRCEESALPRGCALPGPPVLAVNAGDPSEELGTYQVVFNPDAPLSLLPPHLYFLLTDGAASTAVTDDTQRQLHVKCISFLTTNRSDTLFKLCDEESSYFGLLPDSNVLVIGGSYFRHNYSAGQIDGWTGEWRLQFAVTAANGPVDLSVLQWVGFAIGCLLLLVLFSRAVTSDTVLTVGKMFAFVFAVHRDDERASRQWKVDMRFILGSLALFVLAIGALVVGWLAYNDVTLPLSGPRYQMLVIVWTALGSLQTVLAAVLTLADSNRCLENDADADADAAYQLARPPPPPQRWRSQLLSWLAPHETLVAWAWVRQLLQITAVLAWACLAIVPTAFAGAVYGSVMMLLMELATILAGLFFHTYYVTGGWIGVTGDIAQHLGFRHGGVIAVLVIETLALLAYAATTFAFFLWPLVDTMNAYHSEGPTAFAALLLQCLVVVAGALLPARESAAVLHHEANKIEAKLIAQYQQMQQQQQRKKDARK